MRNGAAACVTIDVRTLLTFKDAVAGRTRTSILSRNSTEFDCPQVKGPQEGMTVDDIDRTFPS